MKIRTNSGLTIDTQTLPEQYEPFFCADCGGRLGWLNVGLADNPYGICDDCAATLSQGEEE